MLRINTRIYACKTQDTQAPVFISIANIVNMKLNIEQKKNLVIKLSLKDTPYIRKALFQTAYVFHALYI